MKKIWEFIFWFNIGYGCTSLIWFAIVDPQIQFVAAATLSLFACWLVFPKVFPNVTED